MTFLNTQSSLPAQESLLSDLPILDTTADKVAVTINQSATLWCYSHSVPPPMFNWYNDTNKLVSSGRVQITRADDRGSAFPYRSSLTISSVRKEDLGVYKCVSVNLLGEGQVNIHLAVKSECENFFFYCFDWWRNNRRLVFVIIWHCIVVAHSFGSALEINCAK